MEPPKCNGFLEAHDSLFLDTHSDRKSQVMTSFLMVHFMLQKQLHWVFFCFGEGKWRVVGGGGG